MVGRPGVNEKVMGGGDLNLKKSWHPSTFRNLEKVWKAEKAAEKEQQQMDLLRKEKMQEQSLEDLMKLQDHKSSGKNRDMVDWIYSGSTSSAAPVCEDYLLGKKKPVLFESKGTTSAEPSLGISENKGISVRDAEAKAREDPLFLIKKSEQRKNNRGKPSHRAAPSNGRR